jgi:hypothetical protein
MYRQILADNENNLILCMQDTTIRKLAAIKLQFQI